MIAVLRLPFTDHFLWATPQENGKERVKFTSFDKQKKIAISTENLESLYIAQLRERLSDLKANPTFIEDFSIPTTQEYLEKINQAIAIIKENKLPKLVISRPIVKEITTLNITESYIQLCQKYPNTLCYILWTEKELWMGATPEILGKFNKKTDEFTTMSLAGTLPVNEEWSIKEIEEQKPVTQYISEILGNYTNEIIKKSETYNHISGPIKHLRTDFKATIRKKHLENLIAELHPTPAVCGIPKDFCKQKIEEIEGQSRDLYAGYIKIETEEEIFFFVNLRCGKIYQNKVIAIAGGGITALSSPEKEWQETELKSQAILNNLVFK